MGIQNRQHLASGPQQSDRSPDGPVTLCQVRKLCAASLRGHVDGYAPFAELKARGGGSSFRWTSVQIIHGFWPGLLVETDLMRWVCSL